VGANKKYTVIINKMKNPAQDNSWEKSASIFVHFAVQEKPKMLHSSVHAQFKFKSKCCKVYK